MSDDPDSTGALRARRRALLAGTVAALAAVVADPALANVAPSEVTSELGSPRLHGAGRLRFLGLAVYDARLWTPLPRLGDDDWVGQPLALEIEYSRALVGRQIAERSLEEMRRGGEIAPPTAQRWLARMTQLFPDVKAGDRLTGVQRPDGSARFFVNGTLRGEVPEPEFTRRFFGIWLAPHTSEPKLRAALLQGGS